MIRTGCGRRSRARCVSLTCRGSRRWRSGWRLRGRRGAEELVDTLSRVFGAILDVAAGRGGELLKFGGDALLFVFTGSDHVGRAAATAVGGARRVAAGVHGTDGVRSAASVDVDRRGQRRGASVPGRRAPPGAGDCRSGARGHDCRRERGRWRRDVARPGTAALLPARASIVTSRRQARPVVVAAAAGGGRAGFRIVRAAADRSVLARLLPDSLVGVLGHEVQPGHRSAVIGVHPYLGLRGALDQGPDVLAAGLDETCGRSRPLSRPKG